MIRADFLRTTVLAPLAGLLGKLLGGTEVSVVEEGSGHGYARLAIGPPPTVTVSDAAGVERVSLYDNSASNNKPLAIWWDAEQGERVTCRIVGRDGVCIIYRS